MRAWNPMTLTFEAFGLHNVVRDLELQKQFNRSVHP
jgi:hypothetical protein